MTQEPVTTARLGEFVFDAQTGQLTRDGAGEDGSCRLGPQPSKLLSLLIEKQPDLLTREEIQQALWPGVVVDFDSSLHFCIRQIRSALDDSASAPRYIETIPRRGYRLVSEVEIPGNGTTTAALPPPAANPAQELPELDRQDSKASDRSESISKSDPIARKAATGKLLMLIAAFGLVVATWAFLSWNDTADSSTANGDIQRIAIMPFESADQSFGSLGNGSLAMHLLESLSSEFGKTLDVIGPTTTSQFDGKPTGLRELVNEIRPVYIVNARYLAQEDAASGRRMLVEIIRSSDGAHVWVRSYESGSSPQRIISQILEALGNKLKAGA